MTTLIGHVEHVSNKEKTNHSPPDKVEENVWLSRNMLHRCPPSAELSTKKVVEHLRHILPWLKKKNATHTGVHLFRFQQRFGSGSKDHILSKKSTEKHWQQLEAGRSLIWLQLWSPAHWNGWTLASVNISIYSLMVCLPGLSTLQLAQHLRAYS